MTTIVYEYEQTLQSAQNELLFIVVFTDHHQQGVPTSGTHRSGVCVLLRVHHSRTVHRHAVPSVRDVVAHTRFDRPELVLQQKGERPVPMHCTREIFRAVGTLNAYFTFGVFLKQLLQYRTLTIRSFCRTDRRLDPRRSSGQTSGSDREAPATAAGHQRRLRQRVGFQRGQRRGPAQDHLQSGETAAEDADDRHAGRGFPQEVLADENRRGRRRAAGY